MCEVVGLSPLCVSRNPDLTSANIFEMIAKTFEFGMFVSNLGIVGRAFEDKSVKGLRAQSIALCRWSQLTLCFQACDRLETWKDIKTLKTFFIEEMTCDFSTLTLKGFSKICSSTFERQTTISVLKDFEKSLEGFL